MTYYFLLYGSARKQSRPPRLAPDSGGWCTSVRLGDLCSLRTLFKWFCADPDIHAVSKMVECNSMSMRIVSPTT